MTDEQRLLDHLGIKRSEIDDFLAESREREMDAEDDMHKLLIHLRIACYEGGYPACEACFSSIEEFLRLDGSKDKLLDSLRSKAG